MASLSATDAPFGDTSDAIYLGGSATPAGVPYSMQVALAGRGYLVNLREIPGFTPGYARRTLPASRQGLDTTVEPGEQSLQNEGLWRRAQDTWILGAGQEYLDNRANLFSLYTRTGEGQSFRSRFWRSKGVDPWVDGHLTLQHDVTLGLTSANTNLKMIVANGHVYVIDGQVLRFSTDGTSWTAVTGGPAATALDLTTDGNTVWVAYGASGIYSTTAGAATQSQLSTSHSNFLLYGNGRLISGDGNVLNEISMTGTATIVVTYPNTATTFVAGTSGPEAIYLGVVIGDRTRFYAIVNVQATGALSVPTWAGELPAGETIKAMAYYDGAVVLGTSRGLRRADISGPFPMSSLVHGPSIHDLGATTALEERGQFCWFGVTGYVDFTDASIVSSGLGRADLSREVFAKVPAYATDLMAPAGITGAVGSIATLVISGVEHRLFAVEGTGVYIEAVTFVSKGVIDSGWIRYGTTEPKAVVAIEPRHEPLPVGASVGMALLLENGMVTELAASVEPNSLGPPAPFTANLVIAEKAMVRITLHMGTSAGPDLHRYVLKALVTPRRIDEIIVPLIVRTRVSSIQADGTDVYFDTLSEYLFLKDLADTGRIVTYQEGAAAYTVWVDQVQINPEKWRDDRAFFEGLIIVRLLTVGG